LIPTYVLGGPFGCDSDSAQTPGETRTITLGGVNVTYSFEDIDPIRAASLGLDSNSTEALSGGWKRRWSATIDGKSTYGRSYIETVKKALERAGVKLDGVQLQ
jgi:hypothetical protein